MTGSILSDPKLIVSDLTGISVQDIGVSTLQVDVLKQEGILINLDISGSSIFICGVDWGELGVGNDSTRAQRMTPGRKYLYPKSAVNRINSVVSAMRQLLERFSYDLIGFRPSRYMHYKAYPAWRAEWNLLIERFNQVKQDLIDMHDQAVDELADELRQIAGEAWKSSVGTGDEFIVFGGQAYDDLDLFTDAVVSKALSRMPSIDDIQEKLHADYRVSMLYGLDDIAKQEAAARFVAEKAQIELERVRAEKQAAYLVEATAQEQFDHEQRMLRLAEQEKELEIQAMMQAEAEHARDQLEAMVSPFQEVLFQLRRQLAKDAEEMMQSIHKNGYVRGKVAERGRGLLELFELMSVQDDQELRTRLIQLKEAIGPVGDERSENTPDRDTNKVVTALEGIKELAHKAAMDLAAVPSRFSFVDVD